MAPREAIPPVASSWPQAIPRQATRRQTAAYTSPTHATKGLPHPRAAPRHSPPPCRGVPLLAPLPHHAKKTREDERENMQDDFGENDASPPFE